MNMIKTLKKTFTMALTALAVPLAAVAAGDGNIFSIHPIDKNGDILSPVTLAGAPTLVGGDTARFVVRLQKNDVGGNPFRLVHVGSGQYDVDWYSRRPKIGIYVSGEFRTAELESWGVLTGSVYTDFIFSYTVKPGDLALPIRLADQNGKMITDMSESTKYYFDFLYDSKYAAAWAIDDSVEGGAAGTAANLWFTAEPEGKFSPKSDGSSAYWGNYDFTKYPFKAQTVDFDDNDESAECWRTVHEGSTQTGGAQPTLHIDGLPTNAVTVYVWALDQKAVRVVGAEKQITVDGLGNKEPRNVAEIKVVAGKTDYPFDIEGLDRTANGGVETLVLSAFPDFQYGDTGAATKIRLDDYVTAKVICTEPLPASVKITPAQTRVTATSTSWNNRVTELAVSFSEPYGEDVEVEIVPGFSRTGSELPWADYIRFSEKADEDVTLQAEPVANPKVLFPAGSKVPTQFVGGAAIVDGKIYVYALRADAFSDGSQAKLTFMVKTDNAHAAAGSAAGGIDGWDVNQSTLTVVAQDPVIEKPAEGEAFKAYAGNPCTFAIAVSDDYANMTNAYKVSIWRDSTDGTGFTELPDDYVPDPKTGVLYKKGTKELPSATYTLQTEPYDTAIKVKSTVSENESEERHVSVTVGAQKGYTIAIADEVSEFDEGTFTQLKITFDEMVPDDCWAYLKPVGEATNVVSDCTWLAGDPEASGQWIRAGETELVFDEFQIMDGDDSKAGSAWKFDVVLLKKDTWSDLADDQYGKFKAKNTVKYNVHNVHPVVTGMTPDGKPAKRLKESGATIKGAWPISETLKHTFSISVEEPGLWDKTIEKDGKRFETVVVFYNEDEGDTEYYPDEAPEDGVIYGDPDTNTCTRVFESAGHYRCEVMLKDKDMKDYDDDQTFVFYFDVVDNPTVTVETEGSYQESDVPEFGGSASIKVKLAVNDCNFPMYLKLWIKPNNDSDNPGEFLLETNQTSCVGQPDGSYVVTIPKGKTEVELPVLRMDGTRDARVTGFQVTGEMPEELNNTQRVPGSDNKYPFEYYVWADPDAFKVINDPPVLELLDPEPSTNVYKTAAGQSDMTITWAFNDVVPDFERAVQGGLTVSFTGGGGKWETNVTSYAEMAAVGATGFSPNFAGKSGRQTVTMTVKDHDGGTAGPYSWEFEVQASKSMQMIAHGPTGGFGAGNGNRYKSKASGVGEGRVWAKGQSEVTSDFWTSLVNCGLETKFTVYAYGYKVGDVDGGAEPVLHYPDGRTGYYPTRDTPLDANGDTWKTGAAPYKYVPRKDVFGREVDSFLYTWLQIGAADTGNSTTLSDAFLNDTIAPEQSESKDSGSTVILPTEKDEEGNYAFTQVEAVFSIEKYWSDNMGDINLDGVPDLYVRKYGMGVFDEEGKVSGDDLVSLTSWNKDEPDEEAEAGSSTSGDFLPHGDESTYGAYIPDLPANWSSVGAKFTAEMEIRGYDPHLNDAPALVGIAGVKPARVYELADGSWSAKDCTCSYLEHMAWKEFKAANPGATFEDWSPERPSDPTKTDTDGDGFDDGYEYYYWYRAHVGYFDEKGRHMRLTGHRYDPRNPGDGFVITPEEIERIFDPMLANGSVEGTDLRDTDNDGLPDKLEFLIGTNPLEFDTDGDGLPDGWELCLAGLDPLRASSSLDALLDTTRNYDGDAMAITSYKLEQKMTPVPLDLEKAQFWTFATLDANGDTDGVQWHAMKGDPSKSLSCTTQETANAWSFVSEGRTYVVFGDEPKTYFNEQAKVTALANSYAKGSYDADGNASGAFLVSGDVTSEPATELVQDTDEEGNPKVDEEGNPVMVERPLYTNVQALDEEGNPKVDEEGNPVYVPMTNHFATCAWPVRLFAGAPVDSEVSANVKAVVTKVTAEIADTKAYAAWVYGKGGTTNSCGEVAESAANYGCLALGRPLAVAEGAYVVAEPSNWRDVAFLHYLVYQEFGFDPRTAWNPNDPLANRWGKTLDEGEAGEEAVAGVTVVQQGGYAGKPARTRAYATYDEFLLYSFFLNNGTDMSGETTVSAEAPFLVQVWGAFTTNPQGPNEPGLVNGGSAYGATGTSYYFGRNSDNGADTDGDGVPDGWELYVMAGPKDKAGRYVYAPAHAGFATGLNPDVKMDKSYFSPFQAFAKKTETSNQIFLGGQANDDGLNQFQEFEGTDTMGYYTLKSSGRSSATGEEAKTGFSTTVAHEPNTPWKWLNKFFPTDPWARDTDGDGIDDKTEGATFAYSTSYNGENWATAGVALPSDGDPWDDGKLWSIPGGGLNPCSVDTDLDGLPDPWEKQYAGKKENVYCAKNGLFDEKGELLVDFAVDDDKVPHGNPLQGFTDGMDGTVKDAYSYPITRTSTKDGETLTIKTTYVTANGFKQVVNRDYDRDGLENWQEYLTGTMRCWRYDDPYSPFEPVPESWYWRKNMMTGGFEFSPDYAKFGIDATADDAFDKFWYMTLCDRESPYYNPHLLSGQNQGAQYFTRVTNAWDPAYCDNTLGGRQTYYYFYDRVGGKPIQTEWYLEGLTPKRLYEVITKSGARPTGPSKYIGCDPTNADSDGDGMDDYYELFHGMNPLLGASGVLAADGGPCDLVYDAWSMPNGGAFEAFGKGDRRNYWQSNPDKRGIPLRGGDYDMWAFPWLNGSQEADPDGDDLRNEEEAIMARLKDQFFHHTDPTPLWMTDSTYSNSLTRLYFRLPAGRTATPISLERDRFTDPDGNTRYFREFDGYYETGGLDPFHIEQFRPDYWKLYGEEQMNWLFSFEENEGYDTDHDGVSDHEEISGHFRTSSDPIDFDSPRRRQAMYFQGPERPSALQTLPFVAERHALGHTSYDTELEFLEFTVECWAKPETAADATVIERVCYVGPSNPGDQEFMRRNFEIALRGGRWCAAFDPNGTLADNAVEAYGKNEAAIGEWTHLAATYDGTYLTLYVNGVSETQVKCGLQPSFSTQQIAFTEEQEFWFGRRHPLYAFIVGAAAKTNGQGVPDGNALDLTQALGWDRYTGFFKGYVDEIRVWDGVRSADEVKATMRTRYDAKMAAENRSEIYRTWSVGKRRYTDEGASKDADITAELRFHWSFDSVFGADNERYVAKCPHGFDVGGDKAPLSRPDGYEVAWLRKIQKAYGDIVYDHPAWEVWVPNTVAHLPRFDGTLLDSFYWATDRAGGEPAELSFANSAEPVSRWTQMIRYGVTAETDFGSTGTRVLNVNAELNSSNLTSAVQYDFAGRNRNLMGDDLIPLGGAYVKYVGNEEGGMWDGQGASTTWEITGSDPDGEGLPTWWEKYAEQNYREGMDSSESIGWKTLVNYHGRMIEAREAYLRDLADGAYIDADGNVHVGETDYRQMADVDKDGMPDVWEELMGLHDGTPDYSVGHANGDPDNDGLSNYQEYLIDQDNVDAMLEPRTMKSNSFEIDYFRQLTPGSQYLGELYTDHDMVEDDWEDQWQDVRFSSRAVWDALSDGDGDGWSNYAECRSAASKVSSLANLASHLVGSDETPDMPMPTVKMTVRYNGHQLGIGQASGDEEQGGKEARPAEGGEEQQGDAASAGAVAKLYVYAYTDADLAQPNAIFALEPGKSVSKSLYIGNWENRIVRGTLAPGHIDFNTLNLEFAQLLQNDRYSWTDASGLHLSGTYEEFKAAVLKDPEVLQNVQQFAWNSLAAPMSLTYPVTADKAITVTRDGLLQKGYINLYGERIGTIDLETGDFAFDMNALATTATPYTFPAGKTRASAWSYKEGVFRLTYEAKVPAMNRNSFTFSLAKADEGYVREGKNSFLVFADISGNGAFDDGEPFGIVRDVEVGWDQVPELTVEISDAAANGMPRAAAADKSSAVPVEIRRTSINGNPAGAGEVMSRTMDFSRRGFFCEADVIRGGMYDLDWDRLQNAASAAGIPPADIREVAYELKIGTETTTFTRTFADWKKPVAVSPTANAAHVLYAAHPTFVWQGADGYTAFEITVFDDAGLPVWTSGTQPLPAKVADGYSYEAPVYVGRELENGKTYTWSVAQFNAKFTDSLLLDRVTSEPAEFITAVGPGKGYGGAAVDVRYYGPADEILGPGDRPVTAGDVIVSLYKTADFTGTPAASLRLADGPLSGLALLGLADFTSAQPDNLVTMGGVAPGEYYVMAFMDRNGNGRRDAFEAWGYANKIGTLAKDLYTPVAVTVTDTAAEPPAVVVFLEDTAICGTHNDSLRDLAELEPDSDGDGLTDEEEEFWATDPYDPDSDGDGMPDGWEVRFAGTDPNGMDADYAAPGDVMAYAEVERTLVTFSDGSQALVAKGVKAPEVGDLAVSCNNGTYDAVYSYGDRIGLGLPLTVEDTELRVKETQAVTVVLVHGQVYHEFGYEMGCAVPAAGADAPHTKPFTALDKYLLWKHLVAIGYADAETAADENPLNWMSYTLVPGDADNNRDGIADGWHLYVMFGPEVARRAKLLGAPPAWLARFRWQIATATPWTLARMARETTPGGEGLTWLQEWDGGHYPTNPWDPNTIGDTYMIDGVTYTINDKDAYAYHLKHNPGEEGDKYQDFDRDGLCNYDEFGVMKNNNRTLDADEMFSYFGSVTVPKLAGQCVPDYFLKSTKRNARASDKAGTPVYDYLGFDYTSHDFIESWWKDQYGLSRTKFDPYDDADGDGWSNFAEARTGTNPKLAAVLSIGGEKLSERPTPVVSMTTFCGESLMQAGSLVVEARANGSTSQLPDARWTIGGESESQESQEGEEGKEGEEGSAVAGNGCSRFVGMNPNLQKRYSFGPGKVVPASFKIMIKDPNFDHWTFVYKNGILVSNVGWAHSADDAQWVEIANDRVRANDQTMGDIVRDGKVVGWVNYETGEALVDFTLLQQDVGFGSSETQTDEQGNTVTTGYSETHHTATSYVKLTWRGMMLALGRQMSFALSEPEAASELSAGMLREGLNTFVVFADKNGNGTYDPGEPYGVRKNVLVGWDAVADLNITLSTTSPVLPRFDPLSVGVTEEDEEKEEEAEDGASAVAATYYKGKPVIADLSKGATVRIVRWELNGKECAHRMVLCKTAEKLGVITEADVLSTYSFDLDWSHLADDAAKAGVAMDKIETVTYAVFVDGAELAPVQEENVTGWIVKRFSTLRGKATLVSPTAGKDTIVTATRPTFEFKAPEGYPAFAFELADANGNVVFSSTERIEVRNAEGNVTYRPPVYFGWDKPADTTNRLLPNGDYTWRVALLNAKFSKAEGWFESSSFTVELAKGKVHETDKGMLDVTVRYYGDATVDATHPIVVQAFRTADFTGVPEGQAVITSTELLNSYDNTNAVNAKIFGLAAGDYYVCAFVDTTNDVKRMRWESWGYANKVASGDKDLYTPVAVKVMRNDTSRALVFIEDMDCNNDEIPDWMDPTAIDWVWPWPEPPAPVVPVPPALPEDPEGVDPENPGGNVPAWYPNVETAAGDVMAYRDINDVMFVKVGLSDSDASSRWYAVMDPAGEGWKLRDSDIPLQTPAKEIGSLVSTWEMGRYTGIGTNATFTGDEKVLDTKHATVRLVHAQVYADQGYNKLTANGQAYLAGEAVNTKAFTTADKYYVVRYLENIGVAGVSEAQMTAEVEKALKGVDPADWETVARPIWSKYTLDPDEIDMDRDDIDDGWELYTMFGISGLKAFTSAPAASLVPALADAKISPFSTADGLAVAPGAGSQLKLVEEFDGGYLPTDPWSVDTDRDGVIDYYAYQYHLKGDDAGEDYDGDGLSNYAEYLVSEVFRFAKLDPENPKTDGYCVDYFRKMGDLYLGEVFTDHDQVDDVWEGTYPTAANRDVYDPNRDDDNDGWSNYAEFRAGTDPTKLTALGVTGANDATVYTKNEYPIPVIEAKVAYNGQNVNLGSVVFKAWNDADDPDMLSAPDAIWTVGNGEAADKKDPDATSPSTETASTAVTPRKYVGRKPSGVQTYQLSGGTIESGSVTVRFLDQQFVRYDSNDVAVAHNATSPKDANWYAGVWDKNGKLYDFRDREVGKVDYEKGLLTLDCDKLTGSALGLPNSTGGDAAKLIVNKSTADNAGGQYYDTISLDGANLLLSWSAVNVTLTADGTYYLADADAVTSEKKSRGHVREGKNTFVCYVADSTGVYVPGAPYGIVRGVDVGWQGAKFEVELKETSPITDRLTLWDEAKSDRSATIDGTLSVLLNDRTIGSALELARAKGVVTNEEQYIEYEAMIREAITKRCVVEPAKDADKIRVRVVRYGIDDMFAYLTGVGSPNGSYRDQLVVMEKEFDRNGRDYLSEADFLGDGMFDIDWGTLTGTDFRDGAVVDASGNPLGTDTTGPLGAGCDVTNMTYLVVLGDGPKDFANSDDTNTTVRIAGTICRRFDRQWQTPKCVGVIGGGDLTPAGTVYTAHPTFVWTMPGESDWVKRFGSSYTAFQLRIRTEDGTLVYASDVTRAPKQDADGQFVWTAPIAVGDQTPQGKVFANNATYTWDVAMFNAKFMPGPSAKWAQSGTFSTSVNAQQSQNDAGFSSIGVTVKYTGPSKVLYDRDAKTWLSDDLTKVKGKVRVQAFATADFSGVPACETYVADHVSLADVTDVFTNAVLKGLAAGTYYIRAYIDSNGNFVKDDFESWGYAKSPVTVGPDVIRLPAVSLYIEDADTNGNWYPDAWEYQYLNKGKLSWEEIAGAKAAAPRKDGEIVLSKAVYDQMVGGVAGFSSGLLGAKYTIFQDAKYAELLLTPYLDEFDEVTTTVDAIRKAVEKNVVDKTLKITAMTLDTANSKVILAIDAEVDYANVVSGNLATRLYDLDAMNVGSECTVKVQVFKKETLAQAGWTQVGEFTKTFGKGAVSVEVDVTDNGDKIDTSSGFYMIKVVQ